MVSVGMVINRDDNEEWELSNLAVPELRLPGGKVLKDITFGMENMIFEEVEMNLRRHEPGTKAALHQMRVVSPQESVVLTPREVVEAYEELIKNSSYVSIELASPKDGAGTSV